MHYKIAVCDDSDVEAFAHACRITLLHKQFEVGKSISEVEQLLGKGFIRTHRSYLVGISYMKSISKTEVTLDNGEKIPLSRKNYQAVNQAFIHRFKRYCFVFSLSPFSASSV